MSRTPVPQLLVVALLLSASAAQAQEYGVLDLGPIGYRHQAWSINQNGQVVGYTYEVPDGSSEGFVYDGADFIFIGHPPQTSRSDLLGMNNHGEAAGKSGTVHENGQAIMWTPGGANGHVRSLGTLGGSRSAGKSINDLRQVVGWSHLPGDAESRPFVWEDDVMTALPLLGGTQGDARWINNAGQIVGGSTTDTGGLTQFAVLWAGGDPVRLPPLHPTLNNIANYIHDNGDIAGSTRRPEEGGGVRVRAAIWRDAELYLELGTLADGSPAEEFASSWAQAVNAEGVVVGMSVNEVNQLVPFVYRDGEMVQLDELIPGEWSPTYLGAGAVNDAGQIAVSAFIPGDTSGNLHALLLTPVPTVNTPSTASTAPSTSIEAVPNPFQRATLFRIRGLERSSVELNIFDVSGRRTQTLVTSVSSGEATITWDGRDASGYPVPPGVYFAQQPGGVSAARVLRVR